MAPSSPVRRVVLTFVAPMLQVLVSLNKALRYRVYFRRMNRVLSPTTSEHQQYLAVQLHRTIQKNSLLLPERARHLIDKCSEFMPTGYGRVLCVGCRNRVELDYFRSKGALDVRGIDLYSESSDILVQDMHRMMFPSESFDVVYSSHSLEHSIDPRKAVKEFVRVAKPEGLVVIEVPVNYDRTRSRADLQDFQSPDNLRNLFSGYAFEVVWQETGLPLDAGSDVIRIIVRVQKPNRLEGL